MKGLDPPYSDQKTAAAERVLAFAWFATDVVVGSGNDTAPGTCLITAIGGVAKLLM